MKFPKPSYLLNKIRILFVSNKSEYSHNYWTNRGDIFNNEQMYWESNFLEERKKVVNKIALLNATNILEVGCFSGINLYLISKFKNFKSIVGVDISPSLARKVDEFLKKKVGRRIVVKYGLANKLPFKDRRFDIVFTSGVLFCIGPDDIENSIKEIIRVSKKYVIVAEPYDNSKEGSSVDGKTEVYPNTIYWIRNYSYLFRKYDPKLKLISSIKLKKGIGHINSLLIFEKQSRR